MKSKEERIADLEAQIERIKNEPESASFELIKVEPNGNGCGDIRRKIAISNNKNKLIAYCNKKFDAMPSLIDQRPAKYNLYDVWYSIVPSFIEIVK